MADDKYHFDQLAREVVRAQLKGVAGAGAKASALARDTILAGIRGTRGAGASQSPQESVRLVCKGTMDGLLLIEADLAEGAVALLGGLGDAAEGLGLSPADMMTWAMEGIADTAMVLTPQQASAVQDAIDRAFMGAGSVFAELCRQRAGRRGS